MGMKFKKGDIARQVVPVIEGQIISVAIVDDEVQYELAYTGADGEPHSRFFKEDEIEAAPAAE